MSVTPSQVACPLFARLKTAKRLPSPPGTALRVLELCRNDDCGTKELADAIALDPALSARLLKFANSAAIGLDRQVISIRDAVLQMGVRSVKLAALGFSLVTPEARSACPAFDLQHYWREACAAAVIARAVARRPYQAEPEEAFTAALLAKIGRLAMAQGAPEEYSRALAAMGAGTPVSVAEITHVGADHAELGAALLADWSLPEVLVAAVRCQLDPAGATGRAQVLARVIRTAYTLAPLFTEPSAGPMRLSAAREAVADELNLDEAGWSELAERIQQAFRAIAEVLNVKLTGGAVMDLYAEAQEESTRVGMVANLERVRAAGDVKALLKRANTDALTGAANRARFDERIAELTGGLMRADDHFALVMFDIDHFKNVNDTHGHPAGDLVLTRIARAVQNSLREVDLLARYGGEEFAILAPSTGSAGACLLGERARRCIEGLRVEAAGHTLAVTISVGIAVTGDFGQPPTAADVIAEADRQMYLAKSVGRNTCCYLGKTAPRPAAFPAESRAA